MTQPYILMIDDNRADLELFSEALAEMGEKVDCGTASTTSQGIALIEACRRPGAVPPNIIILDLRMPGHDGKHLLRHIRGCPDLQQTPVVILSSSNWQKDRDECLALGATHYRVKPLDWPSYLDLVTFLRQFWIQPPGQGTEAHAGGTP